MIESTPSAYHRILTMNGGSSSIKFALFEKREPLLRLMRGKIARIGLQDSCIDVENLIEGQKRSQVIRIANHAEAVLYLCELLEREVDLSTIRAIGHRIVHGMRHTKTEYVSQSLIDDLRSIVPCDPQHLPSEIELIEAWRARVPHLPQIACFDTEFHSSMPKVATLFALPRRLLHLGIQRYGFHGLSYAFQMQELGELGDRAARSGRVILAHLGNGASLSAVRNGQCIDTSMGFTPAAGVSMSTRAGDLDPGIVGYLARSEKMTTEQFDHMIHHESGLLGVSETSSDVQDLLSAATTDVRAAEAIELFCYQVRKWIGSFVAALGGLDTLVFAGGVGENSPQIRKNICDELSCFGINLDDSSNKANAKVISTVGSRVTVRIIKTDEEQMIAREVIRKLKSDNE